MRITNELLENKLNILKSISNLNLEIDGAYGGYRLVEIESKTRSIIRVISEGGRLTKKELYNQISSMINILK